MAAPRILVVADPAEAERMAVWLREAGLGEVATGDGSDDTVAAFERAPAAVLVLTVGLAAGDALSLAGALRGDRSTPALVLVGEETGPVRTALDAVEFRADRFLRRPLAQASLVWAARSCLEQRPRSERAATDADPIVREMIAERLEQATSQALDEISEELLDRALPPAPVEEPPAPGWREPTQIIPTHPAPSAGAQPSPPGVASAGSAAGAGTFVSELRKHMSAVEARLFGEGTPSAPPPDDGPPDIDLDAFGMSTLPGLPIDALEAPTPSPTVAPEPAANPGTSVDTAPRGGNLADDDVAALLARLYRDRLTGRVDFRRGDVLKTVFFEEGRAVFATSNLPHDRMGDLLVREGKVTRAQQQRARELANDAGRRLGEVLVELGYLKRRELLPAVRRHVEDVVYSLFGWEAGSYVVAAGGPPHDERIRLAAHPHALIVEGIRRKLRLERLHRLVGPPQTVIAPLARDQVAGILAEADLTTGERQAAELFDGRRSLAEVAAAARTDAPTIYALAHALCALGLARRGDRSTHDGADPSRAVHAPASSITGAADLAIDRERVLAKHAHVREADYFTVLGVRRDATPFEIRRAWEAARRDYAVDSFPAELLRDLHTELGEIATVLDEAQRVLRDDRVRAAYSAHLED